MFQSISAPVSCFPHSSQRNDERLKTFVSYFTFYSTAHIWQQWILFDRAHCWNREMPLLEYDNEQRVNMNPGPALRFWHLYRISFLPVALKGDTFIIHLSKIILTCLYPDEMAWHVADRCQGLQKSNFLQGKASSRRTETQLLIVCSFNLKGNNIICILQFCWWSVSCAQAAAILVKLMYFKVCFDYLWGILPYTSYLKGKLRWETYKSHRPVVMWKVLLTLLRPVFSLVSFYYLLLLSLYLNVLNILPWYENNKCICLLFASPEQLQFLMIFNLYCF